MRKLFLSTATPPDIRPTMLAMSALMMILLPTLLLVTNPQKLVGISLSMAGSNAEIPPPPPGIVESLKISVEDNGFHLTADVRNTDVLSSRGDIERKTWLFTTWKECIDQLKKLKRLDPKGERIILVPEDSSPTKEVIHWMDTLKQDNLFPDVILQSGQ